MTGSDSADDSADNLKLVIVRPFTSWNGTGSCFLLCLGQGVVYKLERSCTRLLLKGFC